ncbi:MAG: DsrE family protein [Sulfuricurvum sp.]|nr:DsrE family protein [Sulfuricurvum sp.]
MKKWFFILILAVSLHAEEIVHKVVFDLTTGDSKTFEKIILSGIPVQKTHFENKMEELEVAVVIHGEAYRFFVKNLTNTPYKKDTTLSKLQETFLKRLTGSVNTYKVSYFMCESGMKRNKIVKENVYDFVTLVPTSTIGLIEKQNEGYAYIPAR